MMTIFTQIFKAFSQTLLPHYCVLCQLEPTKTGLCPACTKMLPWQEACCPQCAMPQTEHKLCGRCLQHEYAFDHIIAPLRYEHSLRQLMVRFKFQEQLLCANLFSALLFDALNARTDFSKPDILLPVPLHAKRMTERGFNQALEIAKPLAQVLQIPLARNVLYKKRATAPQQGRDFKARKKNLNAVFGVKNSVIPEHVGLVDDVVTTGSTAHEIAQVLKAHGAKRVTVLAVARTVLK